ncbi:SUKH-3 domain-containing protein [Catenuloplanes japonicus]|uniref:SUKH-3 domain-containing protein n=1 Tax=Catenuloplanes japonicus TaxID=33876 RepID=UPI000527D3FF|nr:SUKH-3 domain-containing protein [Catenuloplanes japonicus]
MITREEADALAAVWAERDSLRHGYQCTPELYEFDLGYVIWTRRPQGVFTQPDDGGRTVVDRETGELSAFPSLPPAMVEEQYRRTRRIRIRTADPAVELRRTLRRLPTPTTAAHLTVGSDETGYDLFIARGAKGDQTLNHHPLVRDYLSALPAGHLVRGGDRHAEILALSDALHEHDRRLRAQDAPPLTLDTARELLRGAMLEVFPVREPGDPVLAEPLLPAESSIRALAHFGVLPESDLVFAEEQFPEPPPPGLEVAEPDPARFPPDVAEDLKSAAWEPNFAYPVYAEEGIKEAVAVAGRRHRHESFPAALAALTEFPLLASSRRGPGRDVWIRRVQINPARNAYNADTLADFGRLIGTRLFPMGSEEGHSIIAVDERGNVFALDQAGEWFLGATVDQAMIALLQGHAPARVRDDGTW